MSPVAILDMDYSDFVELSAANRAVTLRRPWFEDEERGHRAMIWERQFGHKTGKIRNPKYRKNNTDDEALDYGE